MTSINEKNMALRNTNPQYFGILSCNDYVLGVLRISAHNLELACNVIDVLLIGTHAALVAKNVARVCSILGASLCVRKCVLFGPFRLLTRYFLLVLNPLLKIRPLTIYVMAGHKNVMYGAP